MYTKLPNLVLGFHGCDKKVYESVLYRHEELRQSKNKYDWLGPGIYFWENNVERARQWAEDHCRRTGRGEPAVIGAVIDLGHCLNLTDSAFSGELSKAYDYLCLFCESAGEPLPTNHGGKDLLLRDLDCAVINQLHVFDEQLARDDPSHKPFDSVRGAFSEGEPLYDGSQFFAKTHIQLCVRNPNCIKGYFSPRDPDIYASIP